MVYVTVAEYDPVWYLGSLTRVQEVEPEFPAAFELAPAPKVATVVADVVLAV